MTSLTKQMERKMKTTTITLTEDQLGFLEAALEKAMDNECDEEYYEAFVELFDITKQAVDLINQ